MSKAKPRDVQYLEFRNGLYQGFQTNNKPEGYGLILDDHMRLYASEWVDGQPDGRTLVFNGSGKYIYGLWQNGLPNGFVIFRSGELVLVGHFNNGRLEGEFITLFERQGFLVVVEVAESTYRVKRRIEYKTEEDIKRVSETLSFSVPIPLDYFSVVKFIKTSFTSERQ